MSSGRGGWLRAVRAWAATPGRKRRVRRSPVAACERLEGRELLTALVVNSLADESKAGDRLVTLREAVRAANTDTATDLGRAGNGADRIVFAKSLAGGTVRLTTLRQLTLTDDVRIVGLGAQRLRIALPEDYERPSAGPGLRRFPGVRLFKVQPGVTATIAGLTLADGDADEGGAINNFGTLTVTACAFNGNEAFVGGAILSRGVLDVVDSTFRNNVGRIGGAILNRPDSVLTVSGSAFRRNSAAIGGAIENGAGVEFRAATATIVDSIFVGNSAGNGGAILSRGQTDLTVVGGRFVGNRATEGGAIKNHGALSLDGVLFAGNETYQRTDVNGNTYGGIGGAVLNGHIGSVVATGTTFTGNTAVEGGAIYTYGTGVNAASLYAVSVAGSTFAGNTALLDGGAIRTFVDAFIVNSTFSGNAAGRNGGAIANEGELVLRNSTLTGNRADADGAVVGTGGAGNGGGVWTRDVPAAVTTLFNTLVIGNVVGTGTTASDLAGKAVDAASGHNLIGDAGSAGGLTDGTNGNVVGANAADVLDPMLADNGGPTLTHALVAAGAAVDAGSHAHALDADGDPLAADQRGFDRFFGSAVDIGAFEVQA